MNEFKVFDVESGEDVTENRDWLIDSDGELKYISDDRDDLVPAHDRYQVRRSTGISDKNDRMLFDREWVGYSHGGKVFKKQIKQGGYGTWLLGGSNLGDIPMFIEFIEEAG